MNSNEIPALQVQNVVSTFRISKEKHPVDLDLLTRLVPFTEFNSKRFAAAVVRLRNPRTTCLFFGSGKAVCTGANSVEKSYEGARAHTEMLKLGGMQLEFRDFKTQNIVNVTACGFALDLQRFCKRIEGITSYEPDLFPGLTYRVKVKHEYWIVFLIFQSGKCVITGAKSQQDAEDEWAHFYTRVILPYKATFDFGSSGNYRICQRLAMYHKCSAVQTSLINSNETACNVKQVTETLIKSIRKRKMSSLGIVYKPQNKK